MYIPALCASGTIVFLNEKTENYDYQRQASHGTGITIKRPSLGYEQKKGKRIKLSKMQQSQKEAQKYNM